MCCWGRRRWLSFEIGLMRSLMRFCVIISGVMIIFCLLCFLCLFCFLLYCCSIREYDGVVWCFLCLVLFWFLLGLFFW